MPFYLKERDVSRDLGTAESVLIVPCRFCPAASVAVRERKPYIRLLRNFLRTPSYESYIKRLKARLEDEGMRADVFDSRLPHQFVACMWTSRRRKALAKSAARYDAVIVLGCEAAVATVRSSLPASYPVIAAMEGEGIMSVMPRADLSLNVWLEVSSLTARPYRD
jgi:hypothetical protein